VKVQAVNAGHVIGSAMFLLEFSDGMTLLYTGDFNVVDSIVHDAAKPVSADVLIMETTYGTTEWVFPPRSETHENILKSANAEWDSGNIPLFNVYSLGKAQETIKLLNNVGFTVISGNHTIDAVSDVYGRYGTLLTSSPISSDEIPDLFETRCAIVSSSPKYTKQALRKNIGKTGSKEIESRFQEYSLSGWTLGRYSVRGYPLSAHSDFPGLASFVSAVNPRMVYCFTDNANTFSGYLMGIGVNAVPLE
jgi:putative mRNA 3-end processing factor